MLTQQLHASELPMGIRVVCSDGSHAGHLHFTVAEDEEPYTVKYLIVERGTSFGHDLVVPVEAIDEKTEREIRLQVDNETFLLFPEFSESGYFSYLRECRENAGQPAQPSKPRPRRGSAPYGNPRHGRRI